ncbi:MAG: hypothetical protein COX65_05100, partial [Elusimicrobia bacterium CG_4_10_14_0_2_um_filter_56_8]
MKNITALFPALLLVSTMAYCAQPEISDHLIKARISPAEGRITASDRVSFPSPRTEFVFTLHSGLAPSAAGALIEELPPETAGERYGINSS